MQGRFQDVVGGGGGELETKLGSWKKDTLQRFMKAIRAPEILWIPPGCARVCVSASVCVFLCACVCACPCLNPSSRCKAVPAFLRA